jgi:hypothetical protein
MRGATSGDDRNVTSACASSCCFDGEIEVAL